MCFSNFANISVPNDLAIAMHCFLPSADKFRLHVLGMMEDAVNSVNHMAGHGELHLKYLRFYWPIFFPGALFVNGNYWKLLQTKMPLQKYNQTFDISDLLRNKNHKPIGFFSCGLT